MKIASAQINCTVGHIQSNLEEHYRLIETAIAEGVELIAFPEMSITGYCREEGKGKELLGAYSKDYSLNILMSNYTGELWNMEAGGQSAFWTSDGNLCGQLDSNESGLLIAEKSGEEWTTKKHAVRNG